MEESKSWYQSKTIIGILVTFLAGIVGILKIFGIDLGLGEAEITAFILAVFTVIGTVLAVVGRLKATKSIGNGPK